MAGRFVCKDPAKDLRGDADLYDYCADDPVNYVDREGTFFGPFWGPLIKGTMGALGLGLGGAYGSAKLVDKIQEKRTGQPSTAARDGVKQAAGPTAASVGVGAAGGALAALTPEILAEAMWNPIISETILDMWIAIYGPVLPPPTKLLGWFSFVYTNRHMLPYQIVQQLADKIKHDSNNSCTPQTQPRDEQGRFAPCEHSK